MNLRFLQMSGVPRPQAIAAGAINDAAVKATPVGLLLLALPLVNVRVSVLDLHGPTPIVDSSWQSG